MMSNLGDIYVQGIPRFYSLESFRITFCIILSFECQKDNKDISYYLMFFYRHVKNCHPSIKELKCLFRGCQFVIKVIIQRIITKTVAIIAIIIFWPSIWPPICSFLYTTKQGVAVFTLETLNQYSF